MKNNLIILVIIFSLNSFITVQAEKHVKSKVTSQKPLYDIGHQLLPDTSKYRIINDIIPVILIIFAMLSKHNTQFVNALSIAIVIRIITAYSTVLPKSSKDTCKFSGKWIGGCHDKMFSGHMTVNVLASIAIAKSHPEYIPVLFATNTLAGLSIISSRDHYTIDILVALFLAGFIGTRYINDNKCYL